MPDPLRVDENQRATRLAGIRSVLPCSQRFLSSLARTCIRFSETVSLCEKVRNEWGIYYNNNKKKTEQDLDSYFHFPNEHSSINTSIILMNNFCQSDWTTPSPTAQRNPRQ